MKIIDKIQRLSLFLFRCLNLFIGIVHCTREVYSKCSLCSIGTLQFQFGYSPRGRGRGIERVLCRSSIVLESLFETIIQALFYQRPKANRACILPACWQEKSSLLKKYMNLFRSSVWQQTGKIPSA